MLTILCGIALVLGLFSVHPAIPYFSVLFGSYFALKSSWESIRDRVVDVNILMVLAAIGAIVVGQPLDAAALLFLFSLSSTLESLAMARTRSAIEGLIRLRPDQAVRITNGVEEKVKVEELRIGDTIKIPPFESIPVDGQVISGQSAVDQSAMTGESVPVAKTTGDSLLAGTRNLDSSLVMSVASTVGDSTLDKIVNLVQDAQENKASGERISTWFGQKYTFFVIAAFAVSFGIRIALQTPTTEALYLSLTLLVALSPCALVISTPATTLSALAWAARNGMLVRGGEFIEIAGKIDTIAVDKTGTLTLGRPRLVEICLCARSMVSVGAESHGCTEEEACWHGSGALSPDAQRLLKAAAAAEQYTAHPVAEALMAAVRENGMVVPAASGEIVAAGLGVSAVVDGKRVYVGQRKYLEAEGVSISPEFIEHVENFQKKGMTVALLAHGDDIAALGFMDAPRQETAQFLKDVEQQGAKHVVMLTGDTEQTAKAIAEELGLREYRAALMPAHKSEAIEALVKDGGKVMMVGDGVNDAPSLAQATLGVAMGGLGSDIALNAADVVLMHDRLDRIPELMALGKKTNAIIRANLIFATGVICTLTLLSLFTRLPLPIAVIGHEGSTVLVILNGLRVLRGPQITRQPA